MEAQAQPSFASLDPDLREDVAAAAALLVHVHAAKGTPAAVEPSQSNEAPADSQLCTPPGSPVRGAAEQPLASQAQHANGEGERCLLLALAALNHTLCSSKAQH